jgi:hypothetical protein
VSTATPLDRPTRRTACVLILAGVIAVAASARAQGTECPLTVKPRDDTTGYKRRGDRCEGMFIGLQSAPLKVQVVSLVNGGLHYDLHNDALLYIHVPSLPANVSAGGPVVLQGRGREANLNWALDATAPVGSSLKWELTPVIIPQALTSDRIGLVALVRPSALSDPLFIPLGVTGVPAAARATRDLRELVVRVPGASGVRWSPATGKDCPNVVGGGCREATRLNADGYFRIVVPAGPEGEAPLAIYWRPRGSQAYNEVPEQIRIFRP